MNSPVFIQNPSSDPFDPHKPTRISAIEFFLIVLTCLGLNYLSYGGFFLSFLFWFINLPFQTVSIFFHEISHGIGSIFTGGQAGPIELKFDGGFCYFEGGSETVALFAGYLGSTLWGALIYTLTLNPTKRLFYILVGFLYGVILLVCLFWVRDLQTVCWMVVIIALMLPMDINNHYYYKLLRFVAIYVVSQSLLAPLPQLEHHYISEKGVGVDAIQLQNITGISHRIWIGIWMTIALGTLLYLWLHTYQSDRKEKTRSKLVFEKRQPPPNWL